LRSGHNCSLTNLRRETDIQFGLESTAYEAGTALPNVCVTLLLHLVLILTRLAKPRPYALKDLLHFLRYVAVSIRNAWRRRKQPGVFQ
jgi:hypothetical protein